MADTERTTAELLALFADAQPQGSIDPQNMRDYVVTTDIFNTRLSTGLLTGGRVTSPATDLDPAKFDIEAGTGFYVDNFTDPLNIVPKKVSWPAFLNQTVDNIGNPLTPATFVGLDLSSGTAVVVQQDTMWTPAERRSIVVLTVFTHQFSLTIETVGSLYDFVLNERMLALDMADSIGSINRLGNDYEPGSTGLQISKTAGETFIPGINYKDSKQNPNVMPDPVLNDLTFSYVYQDGGGFFTIVPGLTVVDPNNFDDGSGTLVSVGGSKFSIQRIWFFSELNITVIHYGQATYTSLSLAQAAINSEVFVQSPLLTLGFRGWMIVQNATMDLAVAVAGGNALFIPANKFGE